MGRVIVMNMLSLDGVMQAPGRVDEDTRDGFTRGGWAAPFSDQTVVDKMSEVMGSAHGFLFGRRTYEQLLTSWNSREGAFTDALNGTLKYVASSHSTTRLEWPNSLLLTGDIAHDITHLKESSPANLVIMGSGVLCSSLMTAGVIDEYLLTIAPVILGSGRRLFTSDDFTELRLLDAITNSKGAIIAHYEV